MESVKLFESSLKCSSHFHRGIAWNPKHFQRIYRIAEPKPLGMVCDQSETSTNNCATHVREIHTLVSRYVMATDPIAPKSKVHQIDLQSVLGYPLLIPRWGRFHHIRPESSSTRPQPDSRCSQMVEPTPLEQKPSRFWEDQCSECF